MVEVDLLPEFDDAIAKSDKLAKSLKITADELDKIITISGGVSQAAKGNVDSFTKLENEQKKLNTAQEQFIKLQDKIQKEVKDTTKEVEKEGKASQESGKKHEEGGKGVDKHGDALKKLKAEL